MYALFCKVLAGVSKIVSQLPAPPAVNIKSFTFTVQHAYYVLMRKHLATGLAFTFNGENKTFPDAGQLISHLNQKLRLNEKNAISQAIGNMGLTNFIGFIWDSSTELTKILEPLLLEEPKITDFSIFNKIIAYFPLIQFRQPKDLFLLIDCAPEEIKNKLIDCARTHMADNLFSYIDQNILNSAPQDENLPEGLRYPFYIEVAEMNPAFAHTLSQYYERYAHKPNVSAGNKNFEALSRIVNGVSDNASDNSTTPLLARQGNREDYSDITLLRR